jgi:hypothetical protein
MDMRSSMRSMTGLVGIVVLVGVASGCTASLTVKSKPELTDSSQPAKTSTNDWKGEPITIQNDGVNPLTGTGGIEVTVDSSATKITVSAVFAARYDDGAPTTDAQQSITDAAQTLKIAESPGNSFTISCNHGNAHGSSTVAESGCKLMKVTIPAGSTTQPLDLTVGNGIGDVTFSGPVTAKNVHVQNNGAGNVEVSVTPTVGATIDVKSEFDATVKVPSGFAADSVTLTGPDPAAGGAIDTQAFPNMKSGSGFGTAGTGAKSLSVAAGGVGKLTVTTL